MSQIRVYPAEFPEGHVRPPGWRRGSRAGWRLIDEPAALPLYGMPVVEDASVPQGWAEFRDEHGNIVGALEFDPLT